MFRFNVSDKAPLIQAALLALGELTVTLISTSTVDAFYALMDTTSDSNLITCFIHALEPVDSVE